MTDARTYQQYAATVSVTPSEATGHVFFQEAAVATAARTVEEVRTGLHAVAVASVAPSTATEEVSFHAVSVLSKIAPDTEARSILNAASVLSESVGSTIAARSSRVEVLARSDADAVAGVSFHVVSVLSSTGLSTHDCTVWEDGREIKAHVYIWDGQNMIPAGFEIAD